MKGALAEIQVFWRFVISLAPFLLLVFISSFVIFGRIYRIVEEELIRSGESTLEHVRDTLDSQFKEIERTAAQINMERELRYFDYFTDTSAFSSLMELSDALPDYQTTNSLIIDSLVYLYAHEAFLSPTTASFRSENYYSSLIKYDDLSYQEWQHRIKSMKGSYAVWPSAKIDRRGITSSAVAFVKQFPSRKGSVFLLLDERKLLKLVDLTGIGDTGCFFIIDSGGGIILEHNAARYIEEYPHTFSGEKTVSTHVNGQHLYASRLGSDSFNWTYVMFMPASIVLERANNIRIISIAAFIALIVVSFAFAVLYASQQSKPIKEIMSILGQLPKKRTNSNEYSYIKTSVSELIENNTQLRSSLESQQESLRMAFFTQLLLSDYHDEKTITHYTNRLKIRLHGPFFVVVVAKIIDLRADNAGTEVPANLGPLVAQLLGRLKDRDAYFLTVENDRIAGIVTSAQKDTTALAEALHVLSTELGAQVLFSISEAVENLEHIHRAYRHGSAVFSGKVPAEKRVFYVDNEQNPSQGYLYTIETESRLVSLIRMGDTKDACSLIDKVATANGDVNLEDLNRLISELRATLVKAASSVLPEPEGGRFDALLKAMDDTDSIELFFSHAKEMASQICSLVNTRKESKNSELRDSVLTFIEDNFRDPQLSLYWVSSRFGLTEKYLSRFFKDQTGKNFWGYIEKLRLQYAFDRIHSCDDPMQDIAGQAGYSNINTFYKAFKRNYGVSPGHIRNR